MTSIPYAQCSDVSDVFVDPVTRTAYIDIWYPQSEDNPKYVRLDLMDVRAADDIRVSYDFERDGWKIEQASKFSWPPDEEVFDPDWQEVAFVQSWARST